MIRNIILDWSGTVVDDLDAVLRATNSTLTELGSTPVSKEEFRREFVLPVSLFYDRLLPGVPMEKIDATYRRWFRQISVKPFPGVADFCAFAVATGRRLFVLSTISAEHFESQSEEFGIRRFFTRAYVGVKDKVETIGTLLRANDLDPASTLLVGDMIHDVRAAKSGGIVAVAVATGFDPVEKLASSDPDLIVRDLTVLRHVLQARDENDLGEWIEINELDLKGRTGVPEEERANPQRLVVSLRFRIGAPFRSLDDQLERTIDYAQVAAEAGKVVGSTRARLIETVIAEIADALMARFPIDRIQIELRKFALPNAGYVSVRLTRQRHRSQILRDL
jgi:phosphoglycolate phosphatase